MSTALKNNVGTEAGSDATESRAYLHGLRGNSFLEEVAEVAGLVNPELTIVDARSVLIGNGPFSGMEGARTLGLWVNDLSEVEFVDAMTSVEDSGASDTPHHFELYQNYPNPFNASTKIQFRVNEKDCVALHACDAVGRKISTVINREMVPGEYSLDFQGNTLPSGIYLYQLKIGQRVITKQMTLLK